MFRVFFFYKCNSMQLIPNEISFTSIESDDIRAQKLTVRLARFDRIHPIVSGNKIFKLSKYLEKAKTDKIENLVTLGGAYSNHLLATAFACKTYGIQAYGIVRGEDAQLNPSQTLLDCSALGMKLIYVSRADYKQMDEQQVREWLPHSLSTFIFVPEGGYDALGAAGAATMMDYIQEPSITTIVTAVGTATTLAGLLTNNPAKKKIIAVPVIKNMHDIPERLQFLTDRSIHPELEIWEDYHAGGYAKTNASMIQFMNMMYRKFTIPSDIIYTSKMLFALMDKLQKGYFPAHSHIVALHTGGLQGNLSLPSGVLNF